jgi:hypothetical protein
MDCEHYFIMQTLKFAHFFSIAVTFEIDSLAKIFHFLFGLRPVQTCLEFSSKFFAEIFFWTSQIQIKCKRPAAASIQLQS